MSGAYRPIWKKRAALEAIGFLFAAVLSIIVESFYSKQALGNTEVLLLLLSIVFSGALYYMRLPPTFKFTPRKII